ncbi:MAG: Fe-S cluster assembly ATPase SufC [Candidatus Moranbacteria bacterium RIFCSPHIGHO2_01_FULL_55_24]|nr:MAG: Fe-S cluster assembly ATPase SufC [Candidatus Moranbacteria bacterium RIFCSPHIGHO2_01_FULL_55_24]
MLTIKNLTASIEGKQILNGVSATFEQGKTYALLGPNGEGKSTLGNAIMGRPDITVGDGSEIVFDGKDLTPLSADERARLGIFLSFQNPLPIPGVSVMDLFRMAVLGKDKEMDAMKLHLRVRELAQELSIKDELLKRSLYEGFSGGEKKKVEALQAALLEPRFALFDEIDTGVDVDALKAIVAFLKKHLPEDATLLFITHSHKLLSAIGPDAVLVMKGGKIVKSGGKEVAQEIEEQGFEAL